MSKNKPTPACLTVIHETIDFDFYKTLFDPVRSDILIFLASHGETSIKDISEAFPQDRSVISKHLNQMQRHGILFKEKQGRHVYYKVNSGFIARQFEQTTINIKKLLRIPHSR
jgi:DNA-binding transcriptional ArsR family regulator